MSRTALAALLLVAAGCAGGGETTRTAAPVDDRYVIGVSNTVLGDDRREELICSVKAEALASGQVKDVLVDNLDADADRQAAGIRNLVATGVDVVVLVPAHRTALNRVIGEATAAGAVVVAVDRPVTAPEAYVVTTDQVAVGRLGMEWLAEELGGEGTVALVRSPGDEDRHRGVRQVLAENPGLDAVEVSTNAELVELAAVDGIWAPGVDYSIVEALPTLGLEGVPVVGVDNNAFLRQLAAGAPGAAVTDPAAVGGVGASIALSVLAGDLPPRRTVLEPELWTWPEDREVIESSQDASLPPRYSARMTFEPFTHYTPDQLKACQSP